MKIITRPSAPDAAENILQWFAIRVINSDNVLLLETKNVKQFLNLKYLKQIKKVC